MTTTCISLSGLLYRPPRGKGESQSPAAWNGAASRFWEAGADGIYSFNLFPGPGTQEQLDHAVTVLRTIGSKETLLKADRAFAISDAGWSMPAHYWAKDAEDFSAALPIPLRAQAAVAVSLIVAGPLAADGTQVQTELVLDFAELAVSELPTVALNSQALGKPGRSEAVADVRRLHYAVPTAAVKAGRNEIRVEALSDTAKLAGAELWVRPSAVCQRSQTTDG